MANRLDYEPLDLADLCNMSLVEGLGDDGDAPTGPLTMLGLPFSVGRAGHDERCFIGFREGDVEPVTIPIAKCVRHVIVAHRLLGSDVLDGGELGIRVADYRFRRADADDVTVPIRERFEIAHPTSGRPYRALPDQLPKLMDRHHGDWNSAGRRQTESLGTSMRHYVIWVWTHPAPEVPIEALEITPRGPGFLVAAVTLGHADELPFVRHGKVDTLVTVKDAAVREQPFGIEVDVDRGVATYAQPLPEADTDAFLADDFKGWGETRNPNATRAYSEIAAIASATVTVRQKDEPLASMNWGEVQRKGAVENDRVRVEVAPSGKNWVHVTVEDADTGMPVPCRAHFRSPQGVPYQPHGHHNHVNSGLDTWHVDVGGDLRLGQATYAYIDGTCQGWLPRGEVIVDIARGYEYEPVRRKVEIKPGQRELKLQIKRWTNMNDRRWFSGDSHVHFLSHQGSLTESAGEDLNVVNLLQSQWGSLFTNTEEFTGRPGVSQQGDHIVYVSQENRQHFLGHLILWGLTEPVMPWCSDGPGEAELGGTLDVTMSDWADQTHAQGGTIVIPHFPNPNGEPAALVTTGRADAVEMMVFGDFNHLEYYRYLNCGYRLPLVGGTDKMSSEVPVGVTRTYAYLGDDEFTYDNWCAAVRAGRTMLSAGPILDFSVDGHMVGDTIQLSGEGTVQAKVTAESVLPIHTLQLVVNGEVVVSVERPGGARRLDLDEPVKISKHSWICARCGGPGYHDVVHHHDGWRRGIFAHSSPIYVAVGGQWWMFDESAAQYMLTLLEGGIDYVRHTAPHSSPEHTTHHHGEDDHLAYLERPFHEGIAALHKRMHQLGIPH